MPKKKKHSGIKLEATETGSIQLTAAPSVCRVCLGSDADSKHIQLTDLFGAYRDSTVYEHINSVTDIQIHIGDSLPDKICATCLLDLATVIDFRERCVKSNTALQNTKTQIYKYESEIDIKKEKQEVDTQFEDFDTFNDFFEDEPPNSSKVSTEQTEQYETAPEREKVFKKCKRVLKSKCKIRIHQKKECLPEQEALTCQICKRMFKTYKAFSTHKKTKPRTCIGTQHAIIDGVGKNRIFGCPKCSLSTKNSAVFADHYLRHTGVKDFQCKICPNKRFVKLNELKEHMEMTHREIRVEITCEYCGMHIQGRRKIYDHMKKHSTQRYQCDICKNFYKTRITLINHILTRHGKVKSYKCELCPSSFYTSSALCQHRLVHADMKDWFQCDVCSWKSAWKRRIQNHRAKHNASNVGCYICGIFLQDDSRLQLHLKLHENGKKFTCGVCGKEYLQRKSLLSHTRKKHYSPSAKINNTKYFV